MTHQKAMSHALKVMTDRIDEIGKCASKAHDDGDDEIRDEARILQRGFIECADLLEKMMMLAEMSDHGNSSVNA